MTRCWTWIRTLKVQLFVQTQVKSLAARGETSSDLQLFKDTRSQTIPNSKTSLRRKENEYEEGHDVRVNNLMADGC
jgi:hypothetical protein